MASDATSSITKAMKSLVVNNNTTGKKSKSGKVTSGNTGKNTSTNKKVDNSNSTGKEKVYRTKSYTYVEKDGKITRAKGATPVDGISVIHGPPEQQKLAKVNKKLAKSPKIKLSTVSLLLLAIIGMNTVCCLPGNEISLSGNCFKHGDKWWWLDQRWTAPQRCYKAVPSDGVNHTLIGSNGFDGEYSRLLYINTTTGSPGSNWFSVSKLAPLFEWNWITKLATPSKRGRFIWQDCTDDIEEQNKRLESMIKQHVDSNLKVLDQERAKSKVLEQRIAILEQQNEAIVQEERKSTSRLEQRIVQIEKQNDELKQEMQHLVMDAVNSLLHGNPEVIVDYGVAAQSTPPLVRTRHHRQADIIVEAGDLKPERTTQKPQDIMLRADLGTSKFEISKKVAQTCSCTNGVMKLCNIEVKFNTTKSHKQEESSHCLLEASLLNGVVTRKERLMCKQSDLKDACALSMLVGSEIDLSNATLVVVSEGKISYAGKSYMAKNKIVKDICEFAEDGRPRTLKPTSKYRPIFIACNASAPEEALKRNSNRLHYLSSAIIFVTTFVVETVYQSWMVGLEVFAAGLLGFVVSLDDALLSDNINTRNFAMGITLAGALLIFTANRGLAGIVWFVMIGWLYTVNAIDGITFEVNGIKGTNKIVYETSLNMHENDVVIMGNASIKLTSIRQRKEYDYAYTLPRIITCVTECKNWDCENNAPNCVNKCEGKCNGLSYERCTVMDMYNSCVWSPLKCAKCEGTGALYESLCFSAEERCNLFDSPSNQGDREIVLEYNIDGRTEDHIVKVGQDAYATGGMFRITEVQILSTNQVGTVAKCGKQTWCRKQKLPTKDFCGWYGMESNSSQMDPKCLRIKDTRSYADGASISDKLDLILSRGVKYNHSFGQIM